MILIYWTSAKNSEPCLPTTQRVHDLHAVAGLQHMAGVRAARDDFTIHFHRHATLAEAFDFQQGCNRAAGLQGAGLAIQFDIHVGIVARRRGGCTSM